MMIRNSHTGRPMKGSGWYRNDPIFLTVTGRLSEESVLEEGVTTTVYGPSWVLPGTERVPWKKPAPWDVVRFWTMTEAPERSWIVRGTPTIPTEFWSRT